MEEYDYITLVSLMCKNKLLTHNDS